MLGKLLVLFTLICTSIAAEVYDYDCPDNAQHFYPHPKSCEQFIECNNGEARVIDCFAGFHFNPELEFCDFPENVNCVIEESEEIEEEQPNTGGPVGNCPSSNGDTVDFLTDGADCTIYYVCDWGRAIKMNCPVGLHFNSRLNVCDYPKNAGCTAA